MIKEILVFNEFKPKLSVWTSNWKGKSEWTWFMQQTYDDGEFFKDGIFILIQFKLFALHIKFTWWQFTIKNAFKKKI
jgi:hypothetical protein